MRAQGVVQIANILWLRTKNSSYLLQKLACNLQFIQLLTKGKVIARKAASVGLPVKQNMTKISRRKNGVRTDNDSPRRKPLQCINRSTSRHVVLQSREL